MFRFDADKSVHFCDGLRRRDFLHAGSLAFLGLTLRDFEVLKAAGAVQNSRDVNCILLMLVGGPSQLDTWDMKATSTDSRYMLDLTRRLRVWPHVRIHYQTATNFYKPAYTATIDQNGQVTVPLYRTGDRELSPLLTTRPVSRM